MKIQLCLLVIYLSNYNLASSISNPFSDEFIHLINSKQSAWKAGRNFGVNTSMESIKRLLGVLPRDKLPGKFKLPVKYHEIDVEIRKGIPEQFDSRENWPDCPTIKEIWDQGPCGSCWAFGAAEAMSDRVCIHSNGKKRVRISANNLLACCQYCGYGCYGGNPERAWNYWLEQGLVTGGVYGSKEGCQPYELEPCEHNGSVGPRPNCSDIHKDTPECYYNCTNKDYKVPYEQDLVFGKSIYVLENDTEQIQLEILQNGPIEATYDVYEDFMHYKSGVYFHTVGKPLGGHAVKMLGWGVENNTPYWLIANSWNTDWGELGGFFKIRRGTNECGIEDFLMAGMPRL